MTRVAPTCSLGSQANAALVTALLLAAGCRANFDAQPDATPPDVASALVGCELHLRMEEPRWSDTAPDVLDACGQDDRGLAIGEVTTELDPERGRVGFFYGQGYVMVADSAGLRGGRGVTVSAWVRPLAPVGTPPAGLVAKRAATGAKAAYSLFLSRNAHLSSDIDSQDDRIEVPTTILPDRWTHLTLVYDGSAPKPKRVHTYQDGETTGQWSESSSQIPADFDAPLTIGYLPDEAAPDQYFRGRIDDVVLWSRALGDDEVAAWHAATRR